MKKALFIAILLTPLPLHGQAVSITGGTVSITGNGTGGAVSVSTTPPWLNLSASGSVLSLVPTGSQTQNLFLATPNGSSGSLSLRQILVADLPNSIVQQGTPCSNQVVTALTFTGPTCATVTPAMVSSGIALTGADLDSSSRVVLTHLASPLPTGQGGTGAISLAAANIPIQVGSFTAPNCLQAASPTTISSFTSPCGMSIGGTVTSATLGSIPFVASGPVLAQDNANLFWDASNVNLKLTSNTSGQGAFGGEAVTVPTSLLTEQAKTGTTPNPMALFASTDTTNVTSYATHGNPGSIDCFPIDASCDKAVVRGSYFWNGSTTTTEPDPAVFLCNTRGFNAVAPSGLPYALSSPYASCFRGNIQDATTPNIANLRGLDLAVVANGLAPLRPDGTTRGIEGIELDVNVGAAGADAVMFGTAGNQINGAAAVNKGNWSGGWGLVSTSGNSTSGKGWKDGVHVSGAEVVGHGVYNGGPGGFGPDFGYVAEASVGAGGFVCGKGTVGSYGMIYGSTLPVGGSPTGYATNDTGRVVQGSNTTATFKITAASGGVPSAIALTSSGHGYTTASGLTTTNVVGTGSGLTVNITAGLPIASSETLGNPLGYCYLPDAVAAVNGDSVKTLLGRATNGAGTYTDYAAYTDHTNSLLHIQSSTGSSTFASAYSGLADLFTFSPSKAALTSTANGATIQAFTSGTSAQFQATAASGTGRLIAQASGLIIASDTNGASIGFDTNNGSLNQWLNISSAGLVAVQGAGVFRLGSTAGASTTTAGAQIYDTTNKNIHVGANGVDNIMILMPSSVTPADNDCAKFHVSTGVITLGPSGAACGSGSGGLQPASTNQIPVYNSSTTAVGGTGLTFASGVMSVGQAGTAGSVQINGGTSGFATLSASATGGTLNLGSTNATVDASGNAIFAGQLTTGGTGASSLLFPTPGSLSCTSGVFAIWRDTTAGDLEKCMNGVQSPIGGGGSGGGTVNSVDAAFTGGIVSVTGGPITNTGTFNFSVAGTSGGLPCFTSASTWASSVALAANRLILGGGPGACPTATASDTTTTHALFATGGAPAFRAFAPSDIPNPAGDVTGTYAGTVVSKINGTSVPTNASADQLLATASPATGSWLNIPPCGDTAGNHLNFTHAGGIICGTTVGTISAANMPAFSGDTSSPGGTASLTVTGLQGRSVLSTAPTANQILTWNGSAWGPGALTGGGASLTTANTWTQPQSFKNGPWLDVKAFGALGNGSTDDTAAIQSAINACPGTGCTIFFPPGTFIIGGTSANVTLVAQPASPATKAVTFTANNTFSAGDYVTVTGCADASFTGIFRVFSANSTSFVGESAITQTVGSKAQTCKAARGLMVKTPYMKMMGSGLPGRDSGAPSMLQSSTGASPMIMLAFASTGADNGPEVDNLGFNDNSTNNTMMGALALFNLNSFRLDNDMELGFQCGATFGGSAHDPTGPPGCGFGILLDGTVEYGNVQAWTQWGTIVNNVMFLSNYGIQTRSNVASVTIIGGNSQCFVAVSLPSSNYSKGLDFGKSFAVAYGNGNSAQGVPSEMYVFNHEVENCSFGVDMFNESEGIIAPKVELAGNAAHQLAGTIGIRVDGDTPSQTGHGTLMPVTIQYATGITIGSNVRSYDIVAPEFNTNGTDFVNSSPSNTRVWGSIFERPLHTVSPSTTACNAGQMEWDAGFIYVCTSTNTWKRAALTSY